MSSTFEVPVISIKLSPHPNADTLSLVRIHGYQVVVKTEEWKDGDLAAWIPPDSVVPDRPEWAWLGGEPRHRRIKTRRFRQEWSHGLLTRVSGYPAGRNVAAALGICPYEPPSASREGGSSRSSRTLWQRFMGWFRELGNRPRGKFPYYDIENFRRYADLFEPGELVLVTEKVHGANALYTCKKDWLGRTKIYMRSRTMWKWRDRRDWWQDALRNTPSLERFLRAHPGWTVYGEVYGRGVQELDYGVASPHFVAFDIWGPAPCGRCSICLDYSGGSCHSGIGWMTQSETLLQLHRWGVPTVPVLETGPYQGLSWLVKLTTDTFFGSHSMLADRNGNPNQISEGIVIQSLTTRKILKLVSDKYLEKAQ